MISIRLRTAILQTVNLAAAMLLVAGCGDKEKEETSSSDADTHTATTDAASDSAASIDGDTDADGEGDTDADTDTDAATDTDSGTVSPWDGGTEDDTDTFEWVTIEGGTYMMGNYDGVGSETSYPRHSVTVPTYDIWRTEITAGLYQRCMDDGACDFSRTESYCNLVAPPRPDHPVNCINWYQATSVCEWLGGRLPTEAEWEYAARSRGKDILYAWGNEDPTCDYSNIDLEAEGCSTNTTRPVCSYPLGNSDQGLCDLVGNVYEWVQDWMHPSYEYEENGVTYVAPDDGSAWDDPVNPADFKIMRGGGINSSDPDNPYLIFYATHRQFHDLSWSYGGLGVRCARDIP